MWRNHLLEFNIEKNNIRNYYQIISFEFCKYYYRLCDTNFNMVGSLYVNNPKITYLDQRIGNFNGLADYINSRGIYKFEHISFNGTSQPLNDSTILINIVGTITVDNSIYWRDFTETIVIRRNIWDKWYITNSISQLL